MSTLISGTLVDEHGNAAPGWVAVQADRIADVGAGRPPGTPDLSAVVGRAPRARPGFGP
jgi:hypothetical protein